MRSEILIPELMLKSRIYRDIYADDPEESIDGTLRVPFLDGEHRFIGNLMQIHTELSPLHFSLARGIFGGRSVSESEKNLMEDLISRNLASRTVYSYTGPISSDRPLPIFRATGILQEFLKGSSALVKAEAQDVTPRDVESEPGQRLFPSEARVTGDAFQVFFIDDLGDATALSDPIATREDAVQWEERYWEDYFKRNPGTVLYFCSSEVRSVFIPEDDAA